MDLVLAVLATLFCAYGIGANDVSNSFASAIGAKALTLRQGVFCAAIFEFLGAILAGAAVADTIRGGIASQKAFEDRPELLMYGMMIVDLTTGIWLILATHYGLPVSTTHSAVGSIVGMAVACAGSDAVNWTTTVTTFPYFGGLAGIVMSWVISPVIACGFSVCLFGCTKLFVLRARDPYRISKIAFPIYTFIAIWFACDAVVSKGLPQYKNDINKLPGELDGAAAWIAVIVAFGFAVVAATAGNWWVDRQLNRDEQVYSEKVASKQALLGKLPPGTETLTVKKVSVGTVHKCSEEYYVEEVEPEHRFLGCLGGPLVPQVIRNLSVYKWINDGLDYDIFACIEDDEAVNATMDTCEDFDFKTEQVYRYLQCFTSCFNMFAHGSNDVANSIGPFAAVYLVWSTGSVIAKAPVEQWIIAIGGVSMSLGVMTYGYKIIEVMGVKMTKISNTRGLCIDMAAAIVVIIATKYGLPVSSTQTVTGAIIGVGLLDGKSGVNWKEMIKVFFGWGWTLVFTGFTAFVLTSWAVQAPNVGSTAQRIDFYKQINKTSTVFADLMIKSDNPKIRAWGNDIKTNQTKKLKIPAWKLDTPLATLNYTCERGFLLAGIMLPNQTKSGK